MLMPAVTAVMPVPSRRGSPCRPHIVERVPAGWVVRCLRCGVYAHTMATISAAVTSFRVDHSYCQPNPPVSGDWSALCGRRSNVRAHYRDDGSCRCAEVDDLLARFEVAVSTAARWEALAAELGEMLGAVL